MRRFKILTLIDITETKQYRKEPNRDLERDQQQNFSMLIQSIGIRVNPLFSRSPKIEEVDLKNYNFGSEYKGNHRLWSFEFEIEYEGRFTDATGDPTGLLLEDLHFIPITLGLTETIELPIPVFDTRTTQYRNTIIYVD